MLTITFVSLPFLYIYLQNINPRKNHISRLDALDNKISYQIDDSESELVNKNRIRAYITDLKKRIQNPSLLHNILYTIEHSSVDKVISTLEVVTADNYITDEEYLEWRTISMGFSKALGKNPSVKVCKEIKRIVSLDKRKEPFQGMHSDISVSMGSQIRLGKFISKSIECKRIEVIIGINTNSLTAVKKIKSQFDKINIDAGNIFFTKTQEQLSDKNGKSQFESEVKTMLESYLDKADLNEIIYFNVQIERLLIRQEDVSQ